MSIITNTWGYTIPGAPVTKKNSQMIAFNRGTGKRFIKQSDRYEQYEAIASYFLSPKPPKPINYPCRVTCVYYMPTRRRVDLTNLLAETHDVLVKFFILADDNRDIVASLGDSRVLYDKENPRVEIRIEPLGETYEQWKKET